MKYSRTISPHFLSDTSFSYIRSTPFFPAINHTQPAMHSATGCFRLLIPPGGSIFGSYGNLYQLKHDMSYVHSNHPFKWGVEIRFQSRPHPVKNESERGFIASEEARLTHQC